MLCPSISLKASPTTTRLLYVLKNVLDLVAHVIKKDLSQTRVFNRMALWKGSIACFSVAKRMTCYPQEGGYNGYSSVIGNRETSKVRIHRSKVRVFIQFIWASTFSIQFPVVSILLSYCTKSPFRVTYLTQLRSYDTKRVCVPSSTYEFLFSTLA